MWITWLDGSGSVRTPAWTAAATGVAITSGVDELERHRCFPSRAPYFCLCICWLHHFNIVHDTKWDLESYCDVCYTYSGAALVGCWAARHSCRSGVPNLFSVWLFELRLEHRIDTVLRRQLINITQWDWTIRLQSLEQQQFPRPVLSRALPLNSAPASVPRLTSCHKSCLSNLLRKPDCWKYDSVFGASVHFYLFCSLWGGGEVRGRGGNGGITQW